MKKTTHLKVYRDGATVRLHNRRILFKQVGKEIVIEFLSADENAETPACIHACYKGKVRKTVLKLTDEAMDSLVIAYVTYTNKLRDIEQINKIIDGQHQNIACTKQYDANLKKQREPMKPNKQIISNEQTHSEPK